MLARRFTIICLLVSLFGMVFAILVVEASLTPRTYHIANALLCPPGGKIDCQSVDRNYIHTKAPRES